MPHGITIVGLGPGDPGLLTCAGREALAQAGEVYLRTKLHPAAEAIPVSTAVHSFDEIYQRESDFEAVYAAITSRILELGSRSQGVVYAVPGDPMVGEATVNAVRARARELEIPCEVIHGVSFVEPCLAMVGADALEGLAVVDALELAAGHHPVLPPDRPALIGQLYSRDVASDVKLTLMNQYPDEYLVTLIHGAGTSSVRSSAVALHEIDRDEAIGAMTALFLPAMPRGASFEEFQEMVAHLRAPEGCPWDREQTHQSLRQHLMEEAFETLQALDEDDVVSLKEELGDLLLQIVLQAQVATEAGEFKMVDVISGIHGKILRRHPHVFGDVKVEEVRQVLHNWEALKAVEREEKGNGEGVLDGVPLGLPALAQAAEIQARVARVGFDWPELEGVLDKIQEELAEAEGGKHAEAIEGEVGDLLFAVVNYARWKQVDPEAALRMANQRFRRRFGKLEAKARDQGTPLTSLNLGQLDLLWEAAKEDEA
jgi:tetrapyrrole methylase family protein/MazG family protein